MRVLVVMWWVVIGLNDSTSKIRGDNGTPGALGYSVWVDIQFFDFELFLIDCVSIF